MQQQINYSIIIPHKNIPKLLQRCLDSIPRREDVQIIVVDDNSDTDKVDFEHFPGTEDPFVEVVFTKEGRGAGYARNVGLKRAKGKWLLFADADDYFLDNFLYILDIYLDKNTDVVYFKSESVDSDTLLPTNRAKIFNKRIDNYLTGKITPRVFAIDFLVPWAQLLNHNFIIKNECKFEEIIASNDIMFTAQVACNQKSIFVSDTFIYCITTRNGSLTNMPDWYESMKVRFDAIIRRNKYLMKKGYKNRCVWKGSPQFFTKSILERHRVQHTSDDRTFSAGTAA